VISDAVIRREGVAEAVPGRVTTSRGSDRALLQLAPLALGQSAPDTEALVVGEGVLQALLAHLAADADLLGLSRGSALLREEGLRIRLGAERTLLPGQLALVLDTSYQMKLVHGPSST